MARRKGEFRNSVALRSDLSSFYVFHLPKILPLGAAEPVMHLAATFVRNKCLQRSVIRGAVARVITGNFRNNGALGLTNSSMANYLENAAN